MPTVGIALLGPYVAVLLSVASNLLCYGLNRTRHLGRLLWELGDYNTFFSSNAVYGSGGKQPTPQRFWAFDVLDPFLLVSSHFVGDWSLVLLHSFTVAWLPITLAVEVLHGVQMDVLWLTWFTHWSLVLLSLAGGLGLLTQARYMWRKRRSVAMEARSLTRVLGTECSTAGASLAAGTAVAEHEGTGGSSSPSPAPEQRMPAHRFDAGLWGDAHVLAAAEYEAACPARCDASVARGATSAVVQQPEQTPLMRSQTAGTGAGAIQVLAFSGAAATGRLAASCKMMEWDWLSVSYLLTMETAVIAALFLDVYFWTVMVGVQGGSVGGQSTYFKHAWNAGVAFLQVTLTRMPIVSSHFQAVLAYCSSYFALVCIIGTTTGEWRYGLDWHKPIGIAFSALSPLALFASMLFWYRVALWREQAAPAPRGRGRRVAPLAEERTAEEVQLLPYNAGIAGGIERV